MSGTKPKITVQAKWPLSIHRRIKNSTKHLKWSKKGLLAKIIITFFQRLYVISDRDLNTVELLNIPGF